MSNLRTRTRILQAIWDKIEVADKKNVITLDLWMWGTKELFSLLISEDKVSLCPNCEELEKINTMKFLKEYYKDLYSAKDALVCWKNPARKQHLIASWDENTERLSLK